MQKLQSKLKCFLLKSQLILKFDRRITSLKTSYKQPSPNFYLKTPSFLERIFIYFDPKHLHYAKHCPRLWRIQ